ncbi:uncharacterized protein LOC126486232 isoform X2 [Schistocerca serialis cubense]|uniref:uncharacterized protein LOC126486232 isoform X2 n=1 Tax=Schistocerca serialis cubense TaxID=2023355 RepID=UPI00214E2F63|nr:uncharacterized protein LOC126486232 isoform X2 [Schistocerca serialis cubense]
MYYDKAEGECDLDAEDLREDQDEDYCQLNNHSGCSDSDYAENVVVQPAAENVHKRRCQKGQSNTCLPGPCYMLLGTDGITEWTVAEIGKTTSGRLVNHNIMRENPEPTPDSKQYVSDASVVGASRLFTDESIPKNIKYCTEMEAKHVLGNELWSVSLENWRILLLY